MIYLYEDTIKNVLAVTEYVGCQVEYIKFAFNKNKEKKFIKIVYETN